jgi:Spy/CpxP family protein refolding chaperone
MMKKSRVLMISAAVVFLMAGGVFAQAQDKNKQVQSEHKDGLLKELNLTPQQQKKLDDANMPLQLKVKKVWQDIVEKEAKLREMLESPAVTKASVEPLLNELKSLRAQELDHRVEAVLVFKEILTPEQFAKFQEMTKKNRASHKGNCNSCAKKAAEQALTAGQGQKKEPGK